MLVGLHRDRPMRAAMAREAALAERLLDDDAALLTTSEREDIEAALLDLKVAMLDCELELAEQTPPTEPTRWRRVRSVIRTLRRR